MEKYQKEIEAALKKNETIVLGCSCEVEYSGRAEAFLPKGDRVVMIKGDNTLLVHQPEGNAPVNYMKPGGVHSFIIEDGVMTLNAKNTALKEYLTIRMDKVHFLNSAKLVDGEKVKLMGSEKDMSEMIYNNPELISSDFKPVAMEEQTKYGFIDVFGHDKDGNIVIVECKRYVADLSAVTQLRRYVEKIKSAKGIDTVRGIVAAPKITSNAENMLKDWGFTFKAIEPPKYKRKYRKDQTSLSKF